MDAQRQTPTLETAYREHYKRVYGICFRILRDVAEAEDMAQTVFVELARKIHKFRGESAFSTWLHRFTVAELPARQAFSELDRIDLEKAWRQMPNGYKKVLFLKDFLGYEHEEIAQKLALTVGTTKSQCHKARNKMQKLLSQRANPRLVATA
jgi:RNA polymerase sigma-70 factor (ECF subfamily)